jgi:predicted DNA binding CopG/RHH family protein
MSSKRGKFDFLTEERQQREEEDVTQSAPIENTQAHKRTSAQASTERRSSGQRIRTDLLRAFKIMSAETGTPQYLLIEAALEDYLAKKRG